MTADQFAEFKNDEAGYTAWIGKHQHDGYVLHDAGRDFTLHRPWCHHITAEAGAQMTKRRKVCFTDEAAAVRYARQVKGKAPVGPCETCG